MKFTLEIELDNEAMQSPDDVAYALSAMAENWRNDTEPWEVDSHRIHDLNGKTVGKWQVSA